MTSPTGDVDAPNGSAVPSAAFELASYGAQATATLVRLFASMLTAREIDAAQADLVRSGLGAFHIPGAGHEAIATLGIHLRDDDWLACHYRDKALLLDRGVDPEMFFAATLCRATAPGAGRQLPDIVASPEHHVLSMSVPVGNHALHAVGVAAAIRDYEPSSDALVVCSVGDGTTQQGEFLEAIAEAVRSRLRVLFVVEDNGLAISTRTVGKTPLSLPSGDAREVLGVEVTNLSGEDPLCCVEGFGVAVTRVRRQSFPHLVRLTVPRLASHSNADDHRAYRSAGELQSLNARDPLLKLEADLCRMGLDAHALTELRCRVREAVAAGRLQALHAPSPIPAIAATHTGINASSAVEAGVSCRGPAIAMGEALRRVLDQRLAVDPTLFLLGEDIEDPKGDVFGVTRGLSTKYPSRVVNSALSESTIVGTAIGRALAGQHPVAFVQFADFLPLAFNQIANELATMEWRTAGAYSCPVVIMAACGGYRAGLGPFHSQTFDGIATHIPGLDVVMPSSAADAAGLLNACLDGGRPTLFLYPKALLNVSAVATDIDVGAARVPLGVARRIAHGTDLTLVAWGNTVRIARAVVDVLEKAGVAADLFDLRTLAPWDCDAVLQSVQRTGHMVIAHEDNIGGGLGAEITAYVAERAKVRVARVCRPDVLLPCHYESQIALLPSFRSVLETVARLLDLDVEWPVDHVSSPSGDITLRAIGTPADEEVVVTDVLVSAGQRVAEGEPLAIVESCKCSMEIVAPADCIIECVNVRRGSSVAVGAALIHARATNAHISQGRPAHCDAPPRVSRRVQRAKTPPVAALSQRFVTVAAIASVSGGRTVTNADLLPLHLSRTSADVVRRTGLSTRKWLRDDQDLVAIAADAAGQALADARLEAAQIDLLICCTGTPTAATPSVSCQVLGRLDPRARAQAYDLNAACTGYIYALQAAHDYLSAKQSGRAMVVTAEALSTVLDANDFDTAFLFGDAATATVLSVDRVPVTGRFHVHRPVASSQPDLKGALRVPLRGTNQVVAMDGRAVFAEAVRGMAAAVDEACLDAGIDRSQLELVVPHQANARILDALQTRLRTPVFRCFEGIGNTSSSTIPIALERLSASGKPAVVAITAFGGGFTRGAAILRTDGAS